MPIRQTDRGFDIYAEFEDTYGLDVRVQESSSAEEPRVWIFLEPTDVRDATAVHLNLEQANKIIAALEEWKAAQLPAKVDHEEIAPGTNGVKPHRVKKTKRRSS